LTLAYAQACARCGERSAPNPDWVIFDRHDTPTMTVGLPLEAEGTSIAQAAHFPWRVSTLEDGRLMRFTETKDFCS
jgi:hypothetical protein